MPIALPVRAAGTTLTVGELREALAGLGDNDRFTVDGASVFRIQVDGGGLDVQTSDARTAEDDEDEEAIYALAESADELISEVRALRRSIEKRTRAA